jgi:acyl dehydratase
MSNSNYNTEIDNLSDLSSFTGKEVGLSDWFHITQDDINTFAKLTHDEQWIHIDVEKSELIMV